MTTQMPKKKDQTRRKRTKGKGEVGSEAKPQKRNQKKKRKTKNKREAFQRPHSGGVGQENAGAPAEVGRQVGASRRPLSAQRTPSLAFRHVSPGFSLGSTELDWVSLPFTGSY